MSTRHLRRFLWSIMLPGLAGCSIDDLTAVLDEPVPFKIETQYLVTPYAGVPQAITMATARWETVLVRGGSDVDEAASAGACYSSQPETTVPAGHFRLFVVLKNIDGRGHILAQAKPCIASAATGLPIAGTIELDVADIADALLTASLDDIVRHEVAHALGFGTLWAAHGLLSASGTQVYFTGANARREFAAVGGNAFTGIPVPVETLGGAGTAGGHWRSSVFGAELMIGEIDYTYAMPLSRVTVASFADLGYEVKSNAADPFTVSP